MKSYFCSITEINGEYEYTSKFLVVRDNEETFDKDLSEIIRTYRDEGDLVDEYVAEFPDGTMAKLCEAREISGEDYKVLSAYLVSL